MTPECALISKPAIDFARFLSLANKALGYSPARAADACRRQLSEAERFTSCLASILDADAAVGLAHLSHLSFSFLVVAVGDDMLGIVQCASMPVVTSETIIDGIYLSVITGTLGQWREAVSNGLAGGGNVAVCFRKILGSFDSLGLRDLWKGQLHLTDHSARQ